MIGIGGGSGEGQLSLPDLGTNCVYPLKVSGFGAGIQVGISRASAAGPVANLTRLEDFPGSYSATHGEATILAGGGGTDMKNNANNVPMALSSQTQGLNIGVAGAGATVSMPLTSAFSTLYDSMSDQQKKNADQVFAKMSHPPQQGGATNRNG